MTAIDDYIEAHLDETLDRLKRWCAQPSISTEKVGVEEMAHLAAEDLRRSGFEVDIHPTEGFPVLLARTGPRNGPGGAQAPTLLIYNHYDVQPTGERADWHSDPFDPQIRDGKMYGRGVADTKSNIVARVAALDAVRAVAGDLPINVVWVLEGEEEIGSPHLDPFILEHASELKADGCIWEFGGYTWEGVPNVTLGLKGMLSVELVATGANRDLHSGLAAYVPSPVWSLVWALNAIKSPDGRIHIPGFYDKVRVPTPAQERLIELLPDESARDLENWGLDKFIDGVHGKELQRYSNFVPTANILGIEAGYNGPGTKTVLPHTAHAKLDIRLVPDQHPEEVFAALQAFLRERGFTNVEARRISNEGDLLPGISDPESHFVQLVLRALREANGQEPVITPSSAGSGPVGVFVLPPPRGLGVQIAAIGTGYPDTRAHGPNEHIRLSDFKAHVRTFARLVELMGSNAP